MKEATQIENILCDSINIKFQQISICLGVGVESWEGPGGTRRGRMEGLPKGTRSFLVIHMFTILIFGDGFVCISKPINMYTEFFILYQLYLNKTIKIIE